MSRPGLRESLRSPGASVRSEVGLRAIAWVVALDVNRTIGGNASIELLRRSGLPRGWMDESTHGLLVAASRLTPGTNILAYCVGLGWWLRGTIGGLVALAAASLPSAVIAAMLMATLARIDRYFVVRVLLAIGTVIAALLVLASAWYLIRPHLQAAVRFRTAAVTVTAAVLVLLNATPVQTLLVSAIVGAAWPPTTGGPDNATNREPASSRFARSGQ
jgi:chromate transporter